MTTQKVDLDDPVLGFTQGWINGLARQVEQLHVIARIAGRYELGDNVTLHAYGKPAQPDIPWQRHLFFQRHLSRLILGSQVDAAFIHMIPKWLILARPYTLLRRCPMVLWYTHSALSGRLRLAHLLASHVVTASTESYPLPGDKVTPLGHGIDTDHFRPNFEARPSGPFRILSVGRLSPVKRHHVLIEAVHLLKTRFELAEVEARLVGGGYAEGDEDYRQGLMRLIGEFGLERQIELVGPLPYEQVLDEYQQADLFVSCQPTSVDKVVLEAMACAIPTIASSAAFAPYFAATESSLLMTSPEPSSIAQAIIRQYRQTAEERQSLGLALRRQVELRSSITQLTANLASVLEGQLL